MRALPAWPLLCCALAAGAANAAAEIGVVSLAEGGARVLRGATWYRLVPGVRIEDGDIVAAQDRAQVQVETAGGSALQLVGPGALHFVSAPRTGPLRVVFPAGWLKAAIKAPGLDLDMAVFDVAATDAIFVARAQAATAEVFVETGGAKLVAAAPRGGDASVRDARRGEHWSKAAGTAFVMVPRAPKPFVAAMPRYFVDPLPALRSKVSGRRPALVVDHEITYAEAEPWLAGRDRALFERRFASRLRDPAFRKAVEPDVARYPAWDRILHPEKYAPKAGG